MSAIEDPLLNNLLETRDERGLVTITMPVEPSGPDFRQNVIRWSNLLKTARTRLERFGAPTSYIGTMIERAEGALHDPDLWSTVPKGVLALLGPDDVRVVRLSRATEDLVYVCDRYRLLPLLENRLESRRFHLLGLSLGRVAVWEGDGQKLRPLDIPHLPKSLEDAMGRELTEETLRAYSGAPRGPREGISTQFHGHGTGEDDVTREHIEFIKRLDHALIEGLDDRHAPLVIAGVERVADMFRRLSKHPKVVGEIIAGNPWNRDLHELHQRAWNIVSPLLDTERDLAFKRLGRDPSVVETDIGTILRSAREGRVETLAAASDAPRWGSFNPDTEELELHERQEGTEYDLIDLAVRWSLYHGADVYVAAKSKLPLATSLTAKFRGG